MQFILLLCSSAKGSEDFVAASGDMHSALHCAVVEVSFMSFSLVVNELGRLLGLIITYLWTSNVSLLAF